jgi:hypothetical protein
MLILADTTSKFSAVTMFILTYSISYKCRDINPLPVQFKSLLPGQEGCVFFSGHLNIYTCQYALVRLGPQAAFKSSTLECVRTGKGLIPVPDFT